MKSNWVHGRTWYSLDRFAEMLERTIRAYQNRAIETAQVIEELITIAKEIA